MPYIQQVVLGQREFLSVYGSDYDTRDGTCIRDYIHVMDLADGHVKAVDKLFNTKEIDCIAYNLGTGNGSTVLEMIKVSQSIALPVLSDATASCCLGHVRHLLGTPNQQYHLCILDNHSLQGPRLLLVILKKFKATCPQHAVPDELHLSEDALKGTLRLPLMSPLISARNQSNAPTLVRSR